MAPVVETSKHEEAPNGTLETQPTISVYRPLRDNEIRIAKIVPSYSGDVVVCSLETTSLHNLPSYKALSYSWGSSYDKGTIILNGQPVSVTVTLEAALQELRPACGQEPLLIWIDAICINQGSLDERGQQVGLMQTIFEHAEEVMVWLGPASEDSADAWRLLSDLHACEGDRKLIMGLFKDSRLDQFEALRKLFRRDFWFRIWVVQEVTCARSVTVMCGSDSVSWSLLETTCDYMTEFSKQLKENVYHDQPARVFSLMRGGPRSLRASNRVASMPWNSNMPGLLQLLYRHGSKHSTDPCDKVYGLVGISADRSTFGVTDYNLSVFEVYLRAARHIIDSTKLLDVICYNQNDDNIFGLPSWVPDWTRRNLYPKHRPFGLHLREPKFCASGSGTLSNVGYLGDGRILQAEGFVYGNVSHASEPCYLAGSESDVVPTLHTFINWLSTVVYAQGSDSAVLEIFQRTFVGGSWSPDYEEEESRRLPLFFGLCERLLPGSLDIFPSTESIRVKATVEGQSDEVLEKRQRAMVASGGLRMHTKRIVVTSFGVTGLAPMAAEAGDSIIILSGCSFPVVMRHLGQGSWLLIGEIYVDGIMYGEVAEDCRRGKFRKNSFRIY